MDNRSGTKCLKSLHKCERASLLRFWYPQNLSQVHPFFSINVTILWSQDFKMLRKNRNKALLWEIYTQECLKPINKQSGGNGMSFKDIFGKVKNWPKSKTVKVLQKSSISQLLNIKYTSGFLQSSLIKINHWSHYSCTLGYIWVDPRNHKWSFQFYPLWLP